MGGELRCRRPGLNERDPHVPGGDLLPERLAEGTDAVLGGVVDTAVEAGHPPRHRADVDDVGHRAGLALGTGQQVRQGGVRAVEQAEHVEPDHPLPLFERRVDDRAQEHDARVVDQRVQAAQLRHRGGDGALCLRRIRDVRLDHQRRVRATEPLGQGLETIAPPGHQSHSRSLLGQRDRRRLADAAAGARHEGDGPFQSLAHAVSTSILLTAAARLSHGLSPTVLTGVVAAPPRCRSRTRPRHRVRPTAYWRESPCAPKGCRSTRPPWAPSSPYLPRRPRRARSRTSRRGLRSRRGHGSECPG